MHSHTELQTFRRCPREHHYRYVLRREPLTKAAALETGSRVESVIKRWHVKQPYSLEGLDPKEKALVLGYQEWWRDDALRLEKVDVMFKVRLGGVEMGGALDGVGMEGDRRVIWELKTTSKSIELGGDYWRTVINVDPQATLYLQAAQELGISDPWIRWDAIHKPQQRQGKKETDQEFFSRIVKEIGEEPGKYYQRVLVTRSEAEHATHVRDLRGIVHLLEASRMRGGLPPRNVDACFTFFRPCSYFDVCSGATSIEDGTRFKNTERPEREQIPDAPVEQVKYEF